MDDDKSVVWLSGEVKTPPFTPVARVEVGVLLRRLQQGEMLGLPASRPMPSIGARCHELRIIDQTKTWRIVYRIDTDAIIIVDVFQKSTRATPERVIKNCQQRLRLYDRATEGPENG